VDIPAGAWFLKQVGKMFALPADDNVQNVPL
jgi:hypothetical protein